jgi:hypothetical protein
MEEVVIVIIIIVVVMIVIVLVLSINCNIDSITVTIKYYSTVIHLLVFAKLVIRVTIMVITET